MSKERTAAIHTFQVEVPWDEQEIMAITAIWTLISMIKLDQHQKERALKFVLDKVHAP